MCGTRRPHAPRAKWPFAAALRRKKVPGTERPGTGREKCASHPDLTALRFRIRKYLAFDIREHLASARLPGRLRALPVANLSFAGETFLLEEPGPRTPAPYSGNQRRSSARPPWWRQMRLLMRALPLRPPDLERCSREMPAPYAEY